MPPKKRVVKKKVPVKRKGAYEFPKASLTKLCHKAGVRRIAGLTYKEVDDYLIKQGMELIEIAADYAKAAKRVRINIDDIRNAIKARDGIHFAAAKGLSKSVRRAGVYHKAPPKTEAQKAKAKAAAKAKSRVGKPKAAAGGKAAAKPRAKRRGAGGKKKPTKVRFSDNTITLQNRLSELTKKQIVDYAKRKGIKGYSGKNREELIRHVMKEQGTTA